MKFTFIFNYALQPLRLIVRSGLDVPTFATRRLHASPRESTQRRKVELWARNVREFCLNADLHVTFRDLLHAVKLRHGTDGFTSPPKEAVLRIFFTLKIRRLWLGANPWTWVPKASTLPLDHRSRHGEHYETPCIICHFYSYQYISYWLCVGMPTTYISLVSSVSCSVAYLMMIIFKIHIIFIIYNNIYNI